jgi:hypothetical protein
MEELSASQFGRLIQAADWIHGLQSRSGHDDEEKYL